MSEVFEVGLESLSFVLVDVFPGREAVFNDWYENDHFYAGGVLGPGCLAGRRWYASKALREARFVSHSCPFDNPTAGRLALPGSVLSGGEQQMLAIARAHDCLEGPPPRRAEPGTGSPPRGAALVAVVAEALRQLKGSLTIILVEQNPRVLEALADRTITLRSGRISG